MIAIATGIDALDKKIEEVFDQNGVTDLQIVNYREFLLQNPFDTIIMSKSLTGQVEFDSLVFSLRANNVRIIFLTNEGDISELKSCLNYGIYDLIFDPIVPSQVFNVYMNPKTFADTRNVFVIVNGNDEKNKSKDIEKLIKMEEMQHIPLVQQEVQEKVVEETPNVTPKNTAKEVSSPLNNINTQSTPASIPNMNREVQIGMPNVNQNPTYQQPVQQPVQETYPKAPNVEQTMPQTKTVQNSDVREIKPLSNDDFNVKRVIKETQIESVYEVPHDYKKTIVVMSPEATGKTTVAVNLSWYLNKKGIKTSLIDLDFKKKDIYYNFPIDKSGCLSEIKNTDNVQSIAFEVGKNLKVYTENKDIDVELDFYDISKLITSCKKNSQVVVIDLDLSLNEDTIRNILEVADETLIVVDQKISTLNRVPEALYPYRNQLQRVDIVVNRYYNIKHLQKDDIRNFFRGIDIYNGKTFDIIVNRVFDMSDDAKSILQALAERTPAIEIRDNLIVDDIQKICESYYAIDKKKR